MSSFIYEDKALDCAYSTHVELSFFFLKNSRRILLIHLYSEWVSLVLCPTAYMLQHLAFKEELPEIKNGGGWPKGRVWED